MGVIPAEIPPVKYAPMGDPVEVTIHGYSLTLRLEDAAKIEVKSVSATMKINKKRLNGKTVHQVSVDTESFILRTTNTLAGGTTLTLH